MTNIHKVRISKDKYKTVEVFYNERENGTRIKRDYPFFKMPESVKAFILDERTIPFENDDFQWYRMF